MWGIHPQFKCYQNYMYIILKDWLLNGVKHGVVIHFSINLIRKQWHGEQNKYKIQINCCPYLLHLTATSNMSLQLAFLWLILDDLPVFQYLFATCATSRIARPMARWCLTLGRNPSELYWTRGPRVEDLHSNSCKQRMRWQCYSLHWCDIFKGALSWRFFGSNFG